MDTIKLKREEMKELLKEAMEEMKKKKQKDTPDVEYLGVATLIMSIGISLVALMVVALHSYVTYGYEITCYCFLGGAIFLMLLGWLGLEVGDNQRLKRKLEAK